MNAPAESVTGNQARLFTYIDIRNTEERRAFVQQMRAAQETGAFCGYCARTLAPDEPVTLCAYKTWQHGHGRTGRAPICNDCMKVPGRWSLFTLRTEYQGRSVRVRCENCRRPLTLASDRRRFHAVCSDRCLRSVKKAARHRVRSFTCDTCGATFLPARTDSRHCSPACRQKAYRQRNTQR